MAEPTPITVVPDVAAEQTSFYYTLTPTWWSGMVSPFQASWYTYRTVSNVPQEALGWLVAQGWFVTDIDFDNTTNPPTPTYDLAAERINSHVILSSLLAEYTVRYNEATYTNAVRYNDVLEHWEDLIDSNYTYYGTLGEAQYDHASAYLDDLDSFMSDIESLSSELETDYENYAPTTTSLLDGLGTTDEARIREEFAASLATQVQQLINQGNYTSAALQDITARNTRDLDEQIQLLKDRLNREKVDNHHRLYEQEYRMRSQITTVRMGSYTARLDGFARMHAQNLELMRYTMEQRNQLVIGLYGFVERREDVFPSFENMVQIAVGLGDAGGALLSPGT